MAIHRMSNELGTPPRGGPFIRRTRAYIALAMLGYLIAPTAQALSFSLPTLHDALHTPGFSIQVHDKLFSDWQLLELTTVNDAVADLSGIEIIPLDDDPLNPGLKFNDLGGCVPDGLCLGTLFGNQGGSSVTLEFGFTVSTVDGRPLIKDNSLWLNGFVFDSTDDARIRISEQVLDAAGNQLAFKSTFATPDDVQFPPGSLPHHFDEADFAPQSVIHVVKRIDINGPNEFDGAFLTMFEQRFSQVPEPGTVALVALAMVCAGAFARRRREEHLPTRVIK